MNRTTKILAINENSIQRERKTADKWLSPLYHKEIGILKSYKAEGGSMGVSRTESVLAENNKTKDKVELLTVCEETQGGAWMGQGKGGNVTEPRTQHRWSARE